MASGSIGSTWTRAGGVTGRPLIGVTAWRRNLPTHLGADTDLLTLATEYADAVRTAGGIPVVIPDLDDDEVGPLLDGLDGLLLSGGGDIDPRTFGLGEGLAEEIDPRRDHSERALIESARRRRMPVFGICRGLQVINVALGGTLVDDIPRTRSHPRPSGPEERLALRHRVSAARAWPTAGLAPAGDGAVVNSIHHQAADRVAAELAPVAWSEDGVVEALEGRDPDWFVRAVQWHPEKMRSAGEAGHARAILTDFMTAAGDYRRPAPVTVSKEHSE
ncbi:MAG TPA: gamma-glutamyl-gamma-aminobutyrate hydrolase family protein [Trebonia sp.]|nr:gamma-glutamyl-gamma-aminobutyrate hydrolase family protein [Trebonia sp.]